MAETLDEDGYPCKARHTKHGWFYIQREGLMICIHNPATKMTLCDTLPWRSILAATVYAPPTKSHKRRK